jgi:FkbM family methyltransferase
MNYTNPLTRFLFRRDFFKRAVARLRTFKRKVSKDEVTDLSCLWGSKDPKVILDVGANVGFLTWQLTKTFKNAIIYSLEPDPVAFQVLETRQSKNPRVRIFPIAASDREGELAFVQRQTSCTSSLLGSTRAGEADGDKSVKVKATTLDQFCVEQSLRHIDLLKIDTEGADLQVLRGAAGMFQRGSIDVVMAEALFIPTYDGQAMFDEIAAFLRHHGFCIFNVYIGGETKHGQARFGNVIYIGQKMQSSIICASA